MYLIRDIISRIINAANQIYEIFQSNAIKMWII